MGDKENRLNSLMEKTNPYLIERLQNGPPTSRRQRAPLALMGERYFIPML